MSHQYFPPKCDECGDPVDCHSDRCSVGFWKMHDDYLEAETELARYMRALGLAAAELNRAYPRGCSVEEWISVLLDDADDEIAAEGSAVSLPVEERP